MCLTRSKEEIDDMVDAATSEMTLSDARELWSAWRSETGDTCRGRGAANQMDRGHVLREISPLSTSIDRGQTDPRESPREQSTEPEPQERENEQEVIEIWDDESNQSLKPRVQFGTVETHFHEIVLDTSSKCPSDGLAPLGLGAQIETTLEHVDEHEKSRPNRFPSHVSAFRRRGLIQPVQEQDLASVELENREIISNISSSNEEYFRSGGKYLPTKEEVRRQQMQLGSVKASTSTRKRTLALQEQQSPHKAQRYINFHRVAR
jgi:hypothetical protein